VIERILNNLKLIIKLTNNAGQVLFFYVLGDILGHPEPFKIQDKNNG